MKIFAFFMAILVLALSIMPCADTAAMSKGEVKMEASSGNHQDKPQDDDCSPFCQCSCCAGFSLIYPLSSPSTLVVQASTQHSDFLPSTVIEIALPIWQPPKLG